MILPRYPSYQKSGTPWLGKIPSHWRSVPNRAVFREIVDQNHPEEQLLSVTINRGIIQQSELLSDTSKKDSSNLDKTKYKLVLPEDLAYNKMRAWQGALGVSKFRGIISPAYIVMRLRGGNHPRYFHYFFRTPSFAKEAERWSYGITSDMWSLRPEHFRLIGICVPPLAEQKQIARYLDWKTSQIGTFISNKRQLISLLKEQKQNLIHQAIVRGLDPHASTKPSGIEWLGNIPENWEAIKLKRVITPIEQGWSPQCDAQPATGEEFGVLKVGCVNSGVLDLTQNKKLPVSLEAKVDKSLAITTDDILVSRANTRELLGLAARALENAPNILLCDKLFRFRANPDLAIPQFIVLAIRSKGSRVQIESSANGASSSMQNIGQGVIWNLWIPLPPLDEQRTILTHIAMKTSTIDAAIARAEREIELITEYRTRLVADVVTGQVDVRGIDVPEGDWSAACDASTSADEDPKDLNPIEHELEEAEA
ncbi:MAG: hypothetical protein AB3N64_08480 [Puniceicoccaceae bacterium]